jgi:hypothetical protein
MIKRQAHDDEKKHDSGREIAGKLEEFFHRRLAAMRFYRREDSLYGATRFMLMELHQPRKGPTTQRIFGERDPRRDTVSQRILP